MPLVRIDIREGKPSSYRRAIGDVVYRALVDMLNVPENDRFQVLSEHPTTDLIADPTYLGIERTESVIFIQITLNQGRSVELKRNFYRAIVDGIVDQVGLRGDDVLVNLVEVPRENWSFGNGDAQYA